MPASRPGSSTSSSTSGSSKLSVATAEGESPSPETQPLGRRLAAEFVGTFWLVLGGVGSAVLAAFPNGGIGLLGVALAFGLTVLTMAYAVGHISGGHFNPAVTVGLWLAGRFTRRDVPAYVGIQVLGAIAGALVLFLIARGQVGFDADRSFGTNGYAEHSPSGYDLTSAFTVEVVLTAVFLLVILGVTGQSALTGVAPVPIGLALTLIHLVSIPVTNTSVNPARSTGPALIVGEYALGQLWLFWLAPLIGAALAGFGARYIVGAADEPGEGRGERVQSGAPKS